MSTNCLFNFYSTSMDHPISIQKERTWLAHHYWIMGLISSFLIGTSTMVGGFRDNQVGVFIITFINITLLMILMFLIINVFTKLGEYITYIEDHHLEDYFHLESYPHAGFRSRDVILDINANSENYFRIDNA